MLIALSFFPHRSTCEKKGILITTMVMKSGFGWPCAINFVCVWLARLQKVGASKVERSSDFQYFFLFQLTIPGWGSEVTMPRSWTMAPQQSAGMGVEAMDKWMSTSMQTMSMDSGDPEPTFAHKDRCRALSQHSGGWFGSKTPRSSSWSHISSKLAK